MSIDEELFEPLAEFFISDDWNPEELDRFSALYGRSNRHARPRNRGLALEAYAKWTISRFASAMPNFHPSKIKSGTLPNGYTFGTSSGGNVHFYNRADKGRSRPAELDALYELEQDGYTTPVIFEISSTKLKKDEVDLKRDLVQQMYDPDPYMCDIICYRRPKDGRPNFYGAGEGYRKIIIIPTTSRLERYLEGFK